MNDAQRSKSEEEACAYAIFSTCYVDSTIYFYVCMHKNLFLNWALVLRNRYFSNDIIWPYRVNLSNFDHFFSVDFGSFYHNMVPNYESSSGTDQILIFRCFPKNSQKQQEFIVYEIH